MICDWVEVICGWVERFATGGYRGENIVESIITAAITPFEPRPGPLSGRLDLQEQESDDAATLRGCFRLVPG